MAGEMKLRGSGSSTLVAVGIALALAGSGPWIGGSWRGAEGDGAVVSGRVALAADARDALVAAGGRVTFAGTPPKGEPIDMSADSYCLDQHDEPVIDRPVRVGAEGGVADVLVHVRNAPAGIESADTPAVLDQRGCLYTPAALAVRAGETFVIRNSDETLHNVHVTPRANRGFNIGQPLEGIESRRSFEEPEIGIPVRCDIHGWMHSTIHVLDHGFFAVTGPEGTFSLPDLPPGEYEIEAWHGTLGTASRTVRVAAGQPVEIAFEFGG